MNQEEFIKINKEFSGMMKEFCIKKNINTRCLLPSFSSGIITTFITEDCSIEQLKEFLDDLVKTYKELKK